MAKRLYEKPPFTCRTAKQFWQAHVNECEVCRRVHVGRPHTIMFACYKGAQLLKEALADAAVNGVQITDQGRAMLSRQERERQLNESSPVLDEIGGER